MAEERDTNAVDPRVDDALTATNEEVDEAYLRQLRDDVTACVRPDGEDVEKQERSTLSKESEHSYVDFEPNDPRNPVNFSRRYVRRPRDPEDEH
jgi:hypothetical protein